MRIYAKTVTINNGTLGAFYLQAPFLPLYAKQRLIPDEQGNAFYEAFFRIADVVYILKISWQL